MDVAVLPAQGDVDEPGGVGQGQDDPQAALFIRKPDHGVVPIVDGLHLVPLLPLGLAEAGLLHVALLVQDLDLSLSGIALLHLTVHADPGVLVVEQVLVVLLPRVDLAVQGVEHDQGGQALVLREALVRLAAQADADGLFGDGDALGAVVVEALAAQAGGGGQRRGGGFLLHLVFRVHVDHVEHDLGEFGGELGADALDHLFPHDVLGDGVAVAAVGGHGVVGVRHGDDPGDLGDLVALQALRVAPAVVALVVIARADAEPGGILDAGEDLAAHHGVHLDLGELLVREPALLGEDLDGHADLAHVVEQSGEVDLLAYFLGFSGLFRDLQRVFRDAMRMSIRVFILCVNGACQRLGGLFKQKLLLFSPALGLVVFIRLSSMHIGIDADHNQRDKERGGDDGDPFRKIPVVIRYADHGDIRADISNALPRRIIDRLIPGQEPSERTVAFLDVDLPAWGYHRRSSRRIPRFLRWYPSKPQGFHRIGEDRPTSFRNQKRHGTRRA